MLQEDVMRDKKECSHNIPYPVKYIAFYGTRRVVFESDESFSEVMVKISDETPQRGDTDRLEECEITARDAGYSVRNRLVKSLYRNVHVTRVATSARATNVVQ